MQQSERISQFSQALWEWYGRHKRVLPWRDMDIDDENERAYRVLVSEIMLQQTQVSRVIIVFKDFISRMGSLEKLADASNTEIIMAWRGMGYNSRALRLRDAAREIVQKYNGQFPQDMDTLLSIKGIGPYTAAAVRNFAFNIPTPCIDTNIRRILHRTFIGPENKDGRWKADDRDLLEIAAQVLEEALKEGIEVSKGTKGTEVSGLSTSVPSATLVPSVPLRTPANWHAALMDYGSLVQTKNNPKWDICVLTQRNIMVTRPADWSPPVRGAAKEKLKKEPGRMVGNVYIPNRIFRGKIVEALRDMRDGLNPEEIGKNVCIDWAPEHRAWLEQLLKKLVKDTLIAETRGVYVLA